MNRNKYNLIRTLQELGFSFDEANQLRRIQLTLHRWAELECGDGNDHASWALERDEETGKPYLVTYPHTGKTRRTRYPDKENGALKRLQRLLAGKALGFYHQTDPRGVALYILRPGDIPDGEPVDCYYNRGLAVAA